MDYLKQPVSFKIKKVLRYIRLYGINRTYYKVLGQLHFVKKYDTPPKWKYPVKENQFVGLIGCGNYPFTTIAYFLTKNFGRIILGCMDIDINRAASLSRHYKIPIYTTNEEEILNDRRIKLVYIASNHATHAEYAIKALEKGKHVYIEKPHVVSEDQLNRLTEMMKQTQGKVFLGFNRPCSRIGKIMRYYLDQETGAGMYNWFVAGHAIDPDHWYFKPEEGGRVLGNLCHWTDFLLRLPGKNAFPVEIHPTRAQKSDCDIAVTYIFYDGTIGAITFSAKEHTFEGVMERFSAHKGRCLITMENFKTLNVEILDKKKCFCNLFRDHGHQKNIVTTADSIIRDLPYDRSENIAHIWNTAMLFLKTKEALEQNKNITIDGYPFAH